MQPRSSAILVGRVAAYGLAAVAIAILANTAVSNCQGRDQGAGSAAASAPARSSGAPALPMTPTIPVAPGGPPGATDPGGRPPAGATRLRALAGKWLNAESRDYFIFKVDGTGAWMVRGRALWQGGVTPAGRYVFRLAWPSTGSRQAAYWQVKLIDGGRRLVFDGTRQTFPVRDLAWTRWPRTTTRSGTTARGAGEGGRTPIGDEAE